MALYLQNYVTPLLTKMLLKQPVELTAGARLGGGC